MQIVIDISENIYEARKAWVANPKRMVDDVDVAIANGTPLPKGHGDLVDRSKIDMSKEWRNVSLSDKSLWIANGILNNVETVIPADKEG